MSKSEEPSTDVDVCGKSEIAPCAAELVYVSGETKTENVDVCEECELIVDTYLVLLLVILLCW